MNVSYTSLLLGCGSGMGPEILALICCIIGVWVIAFILALLNLWLIAIMHAAGQFKLINSGVFAAYAALAGGLFTDLMTPGIAILAVFVIPVVVVVHFTYLVLVRKELRTRRAAEAVSLP